MLFRMEFFIHLHPRAKLLDNRLVEIGVSFVLTTGEEELQPFTTQRLLIHHTGRDVLLAKVASAVRCAALELYRGS